jgi:hypothetical protein
MNPGNVYRNLIEQEVSVMKELLDTLRSEREAVIGFSLEAIMGCNNRKEEILGRIRHLEAQRKELLSQGPGEMETELPGEIQSTIKRLGEEIKVAMGRNMNLLSFSVSHMKDSIETVVKGLNGSLYPGQRSSRMPSVISRQA